MEKILPSAWSRKRGNSLSQPFMGNVEVDTKRPEIISVHSVPSGRYRTGVFDCIDDTNGTFYAPIEAFEGRHHYDHGFEWELQEEKRLVRKVDWRICAWACLMFFALQLDRSNIVQALADNMLEDLGLTTNDYNYGEAIYYVAFLCAELPSQLVSKRLGPDNWMPIQMVAWSFVAGMQAFVSGKVSFWVFRFLLGVFEAGFVPDMILYLSYWYTSCELPKRLAWFWVAMQSTNIVSAFLAFGILHMRGVGGRAGWSWLFALEGVLTGLVGIASYFYLPPSPYQTGSRARGQPWLNEREEKIMANRIIRDDPGKGDMHNRQGLSWSAFKTSIADYYVWPIYLIGLSWNIPSFPIQKYITLNLKAIGFGTFDTSLLTIPASVLFIAGLLFWTFLSERINERIALSTVSQFWIIAFLAALLALPPSRSNWTSYGLSTGAYGMPYIHAIYVALTSRNAGSVRTRTVASALYNMCFQASNIISINIYRADDAPYYYRGNTVLICVAFYNIAIMVAAKLFYIRVNKKRDLKWNSMSTEEKEHYLSTTNDQGNRRLDFRFAH